MNNRSNGRFDGPGGREAYRDAAGPGGDRRGSTIKLKLSALLLAGGVLASASAFAQSADDKKWINQCLSDNKDAKVAASVVSTYCTCMNGKMSDNETRSITQWEKANPNARKACEQEAGWS